MVDKQSHFMVNVVFSRHSSSAGWVCSVANLISISWLWAASHPYCRKKLKIKVNSWPWKLLLTKTIQPSADDECETCMKATEWLLNVPRDEIVCVRDLRRLQSCSVCVESGSEMLTCVESVESFCFWCFFSSICFLHFVTLSTQVKSSDWVDTPDE